MTASEQGPVRSTRRVTPTAQSEVDEPQTSGPFKPWRLARNLVIVGLTMLVVVGFPGFIHIVEDFIAQLGIM